MWFRLVISCEGNHLAGRVHRGNHQILKRMILLEDIG